MRVELVCAEQSLVQLEQWHNKLVVIQQPHLPIPDLKELVALDCADLHSGLQLLHHIVANGQRSLRSLLAMPRIASSEHTSRAPKRAKRAVVQEDCDNGLARFLLRGHLLDSRFLERVDIVEDAWIVIDDKRAYE